MYKERHPMNPKKFEGGWGQVCFAQQEDLTAG